MCRFVTIVQAAGGIGKEIAFAFAEAGAKGVLCADIGGDEATKVAKESRALATSPDFKALSFSFDITDAHMYSLW
jgi:NAD(P)-dependent dehydrogenase (short-subunit alcohol dehydrogenase family)